MSCKNIKPWVIVMKQCTSCNIIVLPTWVMYYAWHSRDNQSKNLTWCQRTNYSPLALWASLETWPRIGGSGSNVLTGSGIGRQDTVGEEALEIYNTFTWDEPGDDKKVTAIMVSLLQPSEEHDLGTSSLQYKKSATRWPICDRREPSHVSSVPSQTAS